MVNQSLTQSLNMSGIQSYSKRASPGRRSDTLCKTDLAGKKKEIPTHITVKDPKIHEGKQQSRKAALMRK